MNKPEALKLLRLLSSLESWSFAIKTSLPDHLRDGLQDAIEQLSKIVLDEGEEQNENG